MKSLFSSSHVVSSAPSWRHPRLPLKLTPLTSFQLTGMPYACAVPGISFKACSMPSPTPSLVTVNDDGEKFDWYSQWYAVMPVCDLDKRRTHAKRVMGLDLVVWWDRNEGTWKVFDDVCPHRLAPLSEGRIDRTGRLQCVYHGWCFDGSGGCMFIPQAPADGAPVHTSKSACVAAYPATVQHDIVWFWPNADPRYKDIILKQKPPYIPELDDPSFTKLFINRDIPYGWGLTAAATDAKRAFFIFICIPVSPGRSRLIWARPRNFGVWIDRVLPRWMIHMGPNLVLDSDLFLLHVEERKITEVGSSNWQKACYVPTKSDALVVGFRRWLNKYASGQVDWRGKYGGDLPPTPPREQLLDRYWSYVVNCRSCSAAYKGLNALELTLQVLSMASVGILAIMKQNTMSALARTSLVMAAMLFFGASKWLAHFVYKNLRYHDYDHAFR